MTTKRDSALSKMKLRIWFGLGAVAVVLMGMLGYAVREDMKRPGAFKFFNKPTTEVLPRQPASKKR